ncbi:MAG: NUDIX domain-containing protein, partial [Rikenellaceae bacterium]
MELNIYYNDKLIHFAYTIGKYSDKRVKNILNAEVFFTDLKNILTAFENYDVLFVDFDQKDAALKALNSAFTAITAGGGVVSNPQGDILMIYRNQRWDLPKGKLEIGEQIEQCALREVQEECGVEGLVLGNKICNTYHIYNLYDKWIIKCTHWYKMQCSANQTFVPQTEEGISEARWVKTNQINSYYSNTYYTIK